MEATLAKLSVADVAAETSHVAGVARGSSARCMVSIAIQVCASVKVPVNNMRRGAVRASHKTKVREHIPFDSDMQAAIVAYLGKRGILARVMYETGCRASEALALCGADFHANGDAYSVSITRQRERVTGASLALKVAHKIRTVPVSEALYRDASATGDARVCDSRYDALANAVTLATTRAGRTFTAHNYRHNRALAWERAGMRPADLLST